MYRWSGGVRLKQLATDSHFNRAILIVVGSVIVGLNNKAKVTMRKAYGYRSFRIAELSLFHVLGKLPEPKLAHDFY